MHLVDTGEATLTGGRLATVASRSSAIGTFMLTYGDGVGDVRLDTLLAFHRAQRGLVTLTAVRPPARFGALEFDGHRIRHFKEKSTLHEGWINGGFSVVEPAALNYITSDVMWEHAPMEALAVDGHLFAYRHEGFWQCMDTCATCATWSRCGTPGGRRGKPGRLMADSERALHDRLTTDRPGRAVLRDRRGWHQPQR